MSVEYRVGDLFAQTDLAAIGQGVNVAGVMGSGIAPVFKRYWPAMYAEYRALCHSGELMLGGVHAWQAESGVWIYNLASQRATGADARLDAIATSLTTALAHATVHDVPSIGLPRIGAGIGGLAWPDVRTVIEQVAHLHSVRVVVVSLPGA